MVLAPGVVAVLEGSRFVAQAEFTPMLPGDDQLIPYGVDSTVSMVRSRPSNLQSTKTDSVDLLTEIQEDGTTKVLGCSIRYTVVKSTKYVLKNNSDRKVNKFYIEHVADSAHGGFVVTTKENCSKSVTGFSRFEFTLDGQKEIEWVVQEQANYSEDITSTYELTNFILRRAPTLIATGVMKKDDLVLLKKRVRSSELISALSYIEMESQVLTERDIQRWQAGSSVDPESGGLIFPELAVRVTKLIDLQEKLTVVNRQISVGNDHIKVVFQNQSRLRENLKSLEKMTGTDLVKRYLTDLDKEEDDLKVTREQIDKNEAIKAQLETQIREERRLAAVMAKKRRAEIEDTH